MMIAARARLCIDVNQRRCGAAMFNATERANFAAHGLIKRNNFLPKERLARAREVIFGHLEREGLWRDGGWLLDMNRLPAAPFAGMTVVKPISRHPAIVDLPGEEASTAASALVDGREVFSSPSGVGLLFTLPTAGVWTVPHQNWHVDFPRLPVAGAPGVQIFAMLETIEPGGGGTLAVTGSHRLMNTGARINSSDLRKHLRREPWFAQLMSDKMDDRLRLMRETGHAGDVEVRVAEMTGEAGDVYFMDLRVLHNAAPNTLRMPRIMLTQRYHVEVARIAMDGK